MTPTKFEIFSHWLLNARIGKAVLWWLERVAFTVGVLATMAVVYFAEHTFFPVITDWKLLHIVRQGDTYVVDGAMRKTRPCELLATSVMAVPKVPLVPNRLLYQITPSEILGGNAPTGSTTWGPWVFRIPHELIKYRDQIAYLEIVGHHKCHALWNQETVYGTSRMEELP